MSDHFLQGLVATRDVPVEIPRGLESLSDDQTVTVPDPFHRHREDASARDPSHSSRSGRCRHLDPEP